MKYLFCILFVLVSYSSIAYNPICSSYYLPPVPKVKLEEIKQLNIGTYNVLNLNESVGKYQTINGKSVFVPGKDEKPIWQRQQVADVIKDAKLDIAVLEEVEGMRSLEQFNSQYLDDAYYPICIQGNDERGIEIGFLVKKNLPFHMDVDSYKDVMWKDPLNGGKEEKLFSRDLPVMKIYFRDEKTKKSPDMILIGTHFKSQRATNPLDPTSKVKRGAQAAETAKIIKGLQEQYGNKTPIMLAGDFNGDIHNPEFDELTKSGILEEALEAKGVANEDRVTHTFHPRDGSTSRSQLDGIFFNPHFRPCVQGAGVYRYKDKDGNVKPIPNTYQERQRNPSDHFMLKMVIDFAGLLAGACS